MHEHSNNNVVNFILSMILIKKIGLGCLHGFNFYKK